MSKIHKKPKTKWKLLEALNYICFDFNVQNARWTESNWSSGPLLCKLCRLDCFKRTLTQGYSAFKQRLGFSTKHRVAFLSLRRRTFKESQNLYRAGHFLQIPCFNKIYHVEAESWTTEIRLTLLVGMVDKITGLLLVIRSLLWLYAGMEQKILNLNIAVNVWPYWFLSGQPGSTVTTVWTLIWAIEKTRRNQTTTRHQWTVALCSAVCPKPFRSKSN